jgi:hypothetical protein
MKKTILVVLMAVMAATPCLAQEVETDGIFSLHGTVWQALPIKLQILPYPWIVPDPTLPSFWFYDGKVYRGGNPVIDSFYIDMLVCSIFGYRLSGPGGGTFPL